MLYLTTLSPMKRERRMNENEARERLDEILRDVDQRLSDEDREAMSTDRLYDEHGLPVGSATE